MMKVFMCSWTVFKKQLFQSILLVAVSLAVFHASLRAQTISLAGTWGFAIDRDNTGVAEKWFAKDLPDNIRLPGTMTENLKGDDITLHTKWTGSIYDSSYFFRPSLAKFRQPGNIKIPFWLTPLKHYVGIAWYQKEIDIPQTWKGKRITFFIERAHFHTRIWLDEKEIGEYNSLVAPHEFTLPGSPTGRHRLTVRMDNSLKDRNVGPDSHSVTDHTQGNWNGMVGKIALQAGSPVFIENVQIYPDVKNKKAVANITVVNESGKLSTGMISLSAKAYNTKAAASFKSKPGSYRVEAGDSAVVTLSLDMGGNVPLWDEFNPALYEAAASLTGRGYSDLKKVSFGMREFNVQGTHFVVNGRLISLRGTVNNCEFPLTGYAPMDVAAWKRVFVIAKSHGLNHMRFHSWCPPEAAFEAADETGFYLQPEGPSWPNHGTSLGDGRFIDHYLYDETNRMQKAYGNHPSFCMLAAGNEPAGRNHAKYLGEFVKYWEAKDARRVYTGASVAMSWPLYPESDYMIKSGSRGLNYASGPESISDYRQAIEKFTMPYVTHEMGQWCVFPNFDEIKKYTGVARAKNFELFQESLADHGMADEAHDFFMASGKLQALCYKLEIEKSLRTPGLGGFQLLGLQDFPGQGTALVGVLDPFWDEKPYINAQQWRRFCNSTVPLSRMSKFVFSNNEYFDADIELYHFERSPLQSAVISWRIADERGTVLASGKFSPQNFPIGNCLPAGKIHFPLSGVAKASRLNLEVRLDKTDFVNDWDFWVYPDSLPALRSADVYECTALDERAEEVLKNGGRVFLNAAGKVIKGKEIVMQFTPVFWNTSWFKMRPPHVTGFLAQAKHPLFDDFPTEYYSQLQWFAIVNKAQVMHLEDFPPGFKSVIQPIDTWFMNRKLGLIFEAKVGNGKLLVSSANLSDTSSSVAAKQLLYSIRKYLRSDKFNPAQRVDASLIKDLFLSPSKEVWDSFTKAVPDELRPQNIKNN